MDREKLIQEKVTALAAEFGDWAKDHLVFEPGEKILFRVQIVPEDTNPVIMLFDADRWRRLEEIRRVTGIRSVLGVLRIAVRLFDWFILKKAEGWSFQIVKDHMVKSITLELGDEPPDSSGKRDGPFDDNKFLRDLRIDPT